MDDALGFSDKTLERAPARTWQLLLALRYPEIWKKLNANGLTIEDVQQANTLLDAAKVALVPAAAPLESPAALAKAAAVSEVADLDEYMLVKYPPIVAMVSVPTANWMFSDLSPQVGQAESHQVVETILTRLDSLENGGAPEGLDPSVLQALAKRGLDKAERVRIDGLLQTARGADLPDVPAPAQPAQDEAFRATLVKLHLWWRAASAIAKTGGLKKMELIRLGLASRAKNQTTSTEPEE